MEMGIKYIFMIIFGYVISGIVTYSVGYSNGIKRAQILEKDPNKKEDKYTAYIVVAIVFVITGIALSVSLDIWGKNVKTRLILGILTVLIMSGALGGLIGNYYRKLKIEKGGELESGERGTELIVSVLLGIGAALLVPVLLHILTSNLLSEIGKTPEKAYILAGFCLAAAISAEAFIEQILNKVNQQFGDSDKSKINGVITSKPNTLDSERKIEE